VGRATIETHSMAAFSLGGGAVIDRVVEAVPVASPPAGYEIIGPPAGPVIVVLGGISASRHVTATAGDPSAGWWEAIAGPGRAIDTRHVRVLGVDYADGGRGRDGRPRRIVTTHDQARLVAAALDAIGVARAHAVVGASYGGMVALAFAEAFAERLNQLVVISAPHEGHPLSTALRATQRRIVELGLDTGEATRAMVIARGLAMTTYRSARELAERFDVTPVERSVNDAVFPVEGYLRDRGAQFASVCPPERFLARSLSADLHRVVPERITAPTLVVAAEGDTIVPEVQTRELASRLAGPTRFVELRTSRGHDAFLTEPDAVGSLLSDFLHPVTRS
jgi:homoserine O-acetyltransferase